MGKIRVAIWNEFRHEKQEDFVREIYPEGLHAKLKEELEKLTDDFEISLYCLDDTPDHGLTDEVLKNTDVLVWWGHMYHHEVKDEVVERVYRYVNNGMGFIALHSAHASKPASRLWGTNGALGWRDFAKTIVWNVNPTHPIAKGLPEHFVLEQEEIYCEYFNVPKPDDLIFINWYDGGQIFRSGMTFTRGLGKMFYFQPGHEAFKSYYDPNVILVIKNAIEWAAPVRRESVDCRYIENIV